MSRSCESIDHAGHGNNKTKITYAASAPTLNRFKKIVMGHRDSLS